MHHGQISRRLCGSGGVGFQKRISSWYVFARFDIFIILKLSAYFSGVSHFGIGDLELLEKETHKFESRYNHYLIGRYPEAAEEYRRRSPLNHMEKLNCPVAFFQGDADKVKSENLNCLFGT